jgi:hypothetical protein
MITGAGAAVAAGTGAGFGVGNLTVFFGGMQRVFFRRAGRFFAFVFFAAWETGFEAWETGFAQTRFLRFLRRALALIFAFALRLMNAERSIAWLIGPFAWFE